MAVEKILNKFFLMLGVLVMMFFLTIGFFLSKINFYDKEDCSFEKTSLISTTIETKDLNGVELNEIEVYTVQINTYVCPNGKRIEEAI